MTASDRLGAALDHAAAEVEAHGKAHKRRRRGMGKVFPETVSVRFPAGVLDRVDAAALRAGTWSGEWMRRTILGAVERSEKRHREKARNAAQEGSP